MTDKEVQQTRRQAKRYIDRIREHNQATGKELAGIIRSIARISTAHQETSLLLEKWKERIKE